jgi:hypothetical protein
MTLAVGLRSFEKFIFNHACKATDPENGGNPTGEDVNP